MPNLLTFMFAPDFAGLGYAQTMLVPLDRQNSSEFRFAPGL